MLRRRALQCAAEQRAQPAPASREGREPSFVALPLGHVAGAARYQGRGQGAHQRGRLRPSLSALRDHGANVVFDMTRRPWRPGRHADQGRVAKANWQHVFGVPLDKQPPLRINASPGQQRPQPARPRHQRHRAGRRRRRGDGRARCARRAPRAPARRPGQRRNGAGQRRLAKPKGRSSTFEFDIVQNGTTHPIELMNVQLVGDNVAIEGWMGIGAGSPRPGVPFPQLLDQRHHQSQAHGKMRPDGIWEVTAKGPSYDGRDLFQSFFDVAGIHDRDSQGAPGPGSARRNRYAWSAITTDAAQRQDVAAEAEQQAHRTRRARRAGGRQSRSPPCCVPSPGKRGGCGPRPTMPGSYSSSSGFIPTRSAAA